MALLFVVFFASTSYGEGTKEIMPSAGSHGRIEIYPSFNTFALYNCIKENRLNITICEAGEKINMGFGKTLYPVAYTNGDVDYLQATDVYGRIIDPNGNVAYGPFPLPTSGTGFISSHNMAIAGPNTITTGGYIPITYTTTMAGDYYLEFEFVDAGSDRREFEFFDITVVNSTNAKKNGRVWSRAWQFTTSLSPAPASNFYQNPFDGTMFVYADDGVVTSVDFNGMKPLVFTLCANKSGCYNTGNLYSDRKSIIGYENYPQYKVFLNAPDENCFPTGIIGTITEPSSFTGCSEEDYCVNITVNQTGTVEILFNFNNLPGYQPGTRDVLIVTTVYAGYNCIPFNGLDGLGNPVPNETEIDIYIVYYNGLTHLPLTDIEYNENGYIVNIIRPTAPVPYPNLYWDDSNIPGGSVQTSGCLGSNGCHKFYNFFGDSCTINTWWYVSENVTDQTSVTFYNIQTDANIYSPLNDTLMCTQTGVISLHGGFQYADGAYWEGGSGQFLPNNQVLYPDYIFSEADFAAGFVDLQITTYGPGTCPSYSDVMRVYAEMPATVDAGLDREVCLNETGLILEGSILGVAAGVWSGFGGEMIPDEFDYHAQYVPSQSELDARTVTLTLTSLSQICPIISDEVTYGITYIDTDTANSDISCFGDTDGSISLTLDGNTGGYAVVWYDGYTGLNKSGLVAGNYCYTVTEMTGCKSYECVNIREPDSLNVNILPQNVGCDGFTLGGASTIILGGTPGFFHQWNNGATTDSVGGLEEGQISVIVTDAMGCIDTASTMITKMSNPWVDFTSDVVSGCQPLLVHFNETNEDDGNRFYSWVFGDLEIGNNGSTEKNPAFIYYETGLFDVTLTVTTSQGCDSTVTIQDMILVHEKPESEFLATPEFTNIFDPLVSFWNYSSDDAIQFIWLFDDGETAFEENSKHFYTAPGTYNVGLVAITGNDCRDTSYNEVLIKDAYTFYAPSAFTPDANGQNDVFRVFGNGIDMENFLMIIYDRWGNKLFETNNIEEGWDAKTHFGRTIEVGTYTWYVNYKDLDGVPHVEIGPVTIIR